MVTRYLRIGTLNQPRDTQSSTAFPLTLKGTNGKRQTRIQGTASRFNVRDRNAISSVCGVISRRPLCASCCPSQDLASARRDSQIARGAGLCWTRRRLVETERMGSAISTHDRLQARITTVRRLAATHAPHSVRKLRLGQFPSYLAIWTGTDPLRR